MATNNIDIKHPRTGETTVKGTYPVLGMTCASCAGSAESIVRHQQGVVDAAEAPLSTLYASRLYEVADTITLTGHFKAVLGWVMGVEYFDSLPEDVQAILLEEFQRGGVEMTAITLAQEQEYQGRLEDEGVEFFDADIEAYAAKTQSFYSRFTPGLYEEVRSQLD